MSKKIPDNTKNKKEADDKAEEKYMLRLFITGILPNSVRAVINVKKICEKYLKDRYELEIIDIYQQPELAFSEEIIAIPTLIKKFPLPTKKMIGDLSDTKKVLDGLGLNNKNI
ncbi:MAG: circadian clock KaiB family protein [Bacteroidota bacterium]|nr:circadian clock KaiB family protein [Bacteroidota bacterium]